MSVLPLIDALILGGWSSLIAGFLLKVVYITTSYRPTVVGLRPIDFLWVAVVCLLFALALAARTWVKAYEPQILAWRRRARLAQSGYDKVEEPTEAQLAHAGEPQRHAAGR
jgi:hypothetical protein